MNNLARSFFVPLFPGFGLFCTIFSTILLIRNGFSWSLFGLFLSAFAITSLFVVIFINPRLISKTSLNILTALIIIGFAINILSKVLLQDISNYSIILGAFLVNGWAIYLKWYSIIENRANTILKVGITLPDFQLEDVKGQEIFSKSFLGNPSIFLFYRGNWCLFCMAQIKELSKLYHELEKRNVNVLLISPQPKKSSATLAKKYNNNLKFLVDNKNKVAQQLGIFIENGIPAGFQVLGYDSDTVLPTVIITDSNGKIVYLDLTDNYRVRPKPETFLNVIDAMTKNQ